MLKHKIVFVSPNDIIKNLKEPRRLQILDFFYS